MTRKKNPDEGKGADNKAPFFLDFLTKMRRRIMRKYLRNIAKARLRAMGVSKVNRQLGTGLSRNFFRKCQRCHSGRRLLKKLVQSPMVPLWRRVLFGKLAVDGWRAQMGRINRRHGLFPFNQH
jgi:hypothetical protein